MDEVTSQFGFYQVIPMKVEKGKLISRCMAGSARFPSPTPALTEFDAALEALGTAYLDAQTGGTLTTALMYDKEEIVDSMYRKLCNYVEIVADGDDAIILEAGRGKGTRKPFVFSVTKGEVEGTAILRTPLTPRASYIWQRCTDPLPMEPPAAPNESKWEQIGVSTVTSFITTDLVPGVKYWFRVAAVVARVQGPYCDAISMVAP